MNWRNVGRVLRKELRETLRDRRTLIVMVVVPVFLYPALLVIVEQMALFGQRQIEEGPAAVAVVGADRATVAFLSGDSALRVVVDEARAEAALRAGAVDAVVRMEGGGELGGAPAGARAEIVFDSSRDRSRRAQAEVRERLEQWGDSLLARRLQSRGLPSDFAAPLAVEQRSVATAERMGRSMLGQFLPFILLAVTLASAFFPAIDLTAGEKERGTLETLLTSPIPNREIVAGKFLTVVLIALGAAAMNLGSMLLTLQSGMLQLAQASGLQFQLPVTTVLLVLVFLVPLAVFFAALCMGIAVRAQSFKEAQNALTPVQFASLVPMYLPLIPGISFSYGIALIPIGGLAVMFRELMGGTAALGPSVVAVGATVLYALLALRFAAAAFGSEEVLFGGGGEGRALSWRERLRGWRSRPREVPRAGQALLFVALVGVLYFYGGIRLRVVDAERGLFASQWLLLALPALMIAVLGPFRARSTLALRLPSARGLGAAVLVIAGGIPIGWALVWVQGLVFPIPEEYLSAFQELLSADEPGRLLWLLALIAVTPAVCEELVFRGVLLQGLSRELTATRAVVGSALVFGAFHLSFETFVRFLPTAWLGALLGLVVWRTGSILSGMVMHFLNNASVVLLVANAGVAGYFAGPRGEPRWLIVALGALLLAIGLHLLPARRPAALPPS